jgi:hypothetical protein
VDSSRQTQALFSLVKQHHGTLGLELPAPLVDALATIDAQLTGHGETLTVDRGQLTTAVVRCLTNGDDPADDPDVQRMLVRAQLDTLDFGAHLAQLANQRRIDALVEHTPTIVDQLAQVVDQANTDLTDARTHLPTRVDLTDVTVASTLRNPDHLHAWGRARQALDRLRTVIQVWTSLATLTGHGYTAKDRLAPLILADLTPDQLNRLGSRDPLAAALAGLPLSLATFDSYQQRIAAINDHRQREATRQQANDRRLAHSSATNRG